MHGDHLIPSLAEAWKGRMAEVGKAYHPRNKGSIVDCINTANDAYRDVVFSLFDRDSVIDWTTGNVWGKIAPIPPCEVGL